MLSLELDSSAPTVREAAARALVPDPERTCWEWAEQHRIIPPESGSPVPGPYRTDLVPYLREPMEVMSLSHPAERVTFKKSAQVGASDASLNLLGQIMSETPAPALVVTPSIQVASDYNKLKLDPMIRESPALRAAVSEVVSRDESSSTQFFKRFAGGFLQVVGANASKALQMRSVRVILFEELSEFPTDTDGRGAPEDQALERTQAWSERGIKIIDCSTPGEGGTRPDGKPRCRVTALYEQSSKGRFMVRCPHCGHEQDLRFENLDFREEAPEEAGYRCEGEGCGVIIAHHHKREMVAKGRWVHERPELVKKHAGYSINALYSPFISWARIALRLLDAKGDSRKEKVVCQQIKGEAWEDKRDLPSEEILHARRELWPAPVPPEALFLEAATDVQGDRLESAIWGYDADLSPFLIEKIVTPGKPTDLETWFRHDALMLRTWRNPWGHELRPRSWGIDTGYASHHVYRYCRRHAGNGRIKVFALDGRGDPKLPPMGAPSKQDVSIDGRKIGVVVLWPVGTFNLKIDVVDSLRLTELGPDENGVWPRGAMRFSHETSREDLSQLTAEVLEDVVDRRQQVIGRKWAKKRANELFDLAVYARALALHDTAAMTPAKWADLAADVRRAPERQADLAVLWAPPLAAVPPAVPAPAATEEAAPEARVAREEAQPAPPPKPAPQPRREERFERRNWFERRDWFKRDRGEDRAW